MNTIKNASGICGLASSLGILFYLCGCIPDTPDRHVIQPDRSLKTAYVQVAALNLRKCPSIKCEIISVLHVGDAVDVLREQEGWSEIATSANGNRGWLASRYVADTPQKKQQLKAVIQQKKEVPVMPVEEFDLNAGSTTPPIVEESFAPIGDSSHTPAQIDTLPPVKEEFAQ